METLQINRVPVDSIHLDPANARVHGDVNLDSIIASLQRFGQGTVDIGADECYRHLYITGDQIPGGSIQGKLVGLPGTSPVRLFIGLGGVRPTPLPTIYGDLWLLPPRLSIPLVPIPANGILAIPATIPVAPPAPYDIPMQGLIGLNSDSLTNLEVLEVR